MPKRKVILEDWGRISYKDAWDWQTTYQKELVAYKRDPHPKNVVYHRFILCEHQPVITLGKSGSQDHLLLNDDELKERGIEYFKINRGGDITYHGPGQLVGYPILDLDDFFTDVHRYVRLIEQVIINVLDRYDIHAGREEGYTGVWLPAKGSLPKRKICAIGIHLSRWVSMHGFAFNVNTEIDHFNHIVPCGINEQDKAITSMEIELGRKVDIEEVKSHIAQEFQKLFEWDWLESSSNYVTFVKNR